MQNVVVALIDSPSDAEVGELVISLGGEWHSESYGYTGVFSKGRAFVQLDCEPPDSLIDLPRNELRRLQDAAGGPIEMLVSLHYRGTEGSHELVEQVAAAVVQQWGGALLSQT